MVLELLFEYGEHESSSVAQILNVVQKSSGFPETVSDPIRVPFQTNLGSTSSKCSQFYSSSIQLYRARLKRRARRTQSALIDLSYFYRARFATYSIEHGLPRIL